MIKIKPLTLKQAKKLQVGDMLYDRTFKNADGTAQRFKIIGKPKIWKRNPEKVELSLKRGLYEYHKIDQSKLRFLSLKEPERVKLHNKIYKRKIKL